MKEMRRFISPSLLMLLCVVMVVGLAAGCAPAEEEEAAPEAGPQEPAYEDTIIFAIARDTDTLDNFYTTWAIPVHHLLYEPLLSRDWNNQVAPGLAQSWEVSEDGLAITLKLREGMKFHDGTPVTAEAVAEYFRILTDPEVESPSAGDFIWAKNPEVVDELTVIFHLEEPRAYATGTLTWGGGYGGLMSAEAWKRHGPQGDNTYGVKVAVGAGPFKLEEWIPGDKHVLVRFDEYNWAPPWAPEPGPVPLQRAVFRIIPDAATRLAELEAGTIHVLLDLPPEHATRVEEMAGVRLEKNPSWQWIKVMFNTEAKPLDDVRVRKAINLALDREHITETVYRGLAEPLYAYVPARFGDEQVEDREAHRYDPEAAKQLLAEAGYPDGFKTTLAVENRTELVRIAEMVQKYLKDIGIEVEILQMDSAAWKDLLRSGEHEMYLKLTGWFSLDILPWFLASWQIPYPGHGRWNDPVTDDFFRRAEGARTLQERAEIYREAQRYLIDKAVWCPILSPYTLVGVREEVEGLRFHPWYNYARLYGVKVRKTNK